MRKKKGKKNLCSARDLKPFGIMSATKTMSKKRKVRQGGVASVRGAAKQRDRQALDAYVHSDAAPTATRLFLVRRDEQPQTAASWRRGRETREGQLPVCC